MVCAPVNNTKIKPDSHRSSSHIIVIQIVKRNTNNTAAMPGALPSFPVLRWAFCSRTNTSSAGSDLLSFAPAIGGYFLSVPGLSCSWNGSSGSGRESDAFWRSANTSTFFSARCCRHFLRTSFT